MTSSFQNIKRQDMHALFNTQNMKVDIYEFREQISSGQHVETGMGVMLIDGRQCGYKRAT